MPAKPETTFYTSVHRHLPSLTELHREKMANPYRGGTADHWFSGMCDDLWVEYKFITLPKRDDTLIDLVTPRGKSMTSPLSALQQDWLVGRMIEGRNVWVIVGAKEGGVILREGAWRSPFTAARFRAQMVSRKEIADEIVSATLGPSGT